MTRILFIVATALFWTAIAWFALQAPTDVRSPAVADAETTSEAPETPQPTFSLKTLAQHDHIDDCWMAIDGVVYDFTEYIPRHPTPAEVMTAWCGREASAAYHDKGDGEPHSRRADAMLPRYRIGVLN
ncbi:cytochrome b5 domain-containing protein [Azoarcus taiwanensis]|uniref:Cytochrome b5 domain-containing protein n=1 Tax=Azoarcus taiwanensis TaxID=666964 RepID=A0A972F981_9RHOO|nr:cytochrome b5-like heme/steroid binding domain-containing protein [Azoarcus taiwanensis]NMG02309.1 cytochrome b5 domain-containing protein [Azoarcus taiwanensis]